MTASNDKSSSKRHAAASFGSVVDDVQQLSENIADAAASGRDDVSADLRRLSADVARLRNTVAEIAKTMAVEVGDAASSIGEDAASAAKDQAKTLLSEAEAVARRNPLAVVIGAFGIGILIGLMKGRH